MEKPLYTQLSADDLQVKEQTLREMMAACTICPRECGVNRLEDQKGFCRIGEKAVIASFNLHFGEESVLVGMNGSGTIFFSGCNLGCVFCQNYEISHSHGGREVSAAELAEIMLSLQQDGAENINVVTPTHVTPQIITALSIARDKGLKLPIVYNCGGYERLETLQLLDSIIDIYMPDTKMLNPKTSKRLLHTEDYPEHAKQAIKEMHRQVGDLVIDSQGIARKGLLVRHLLMPGGLADTEEWLDFIAETISQNTYVNIMNQYRPCGEAASHPELLDKVSFEEYEQALEIARFKGLSRLDQGGFKLPENLLRRLLDIER